MTDNNQWSYHDALGTDVTPQPVPTPQPQKKTQPKKTQSSWSYHDALGTDATPQPATPTPLMTPAPAPVKNLSNITGNPPQQPDAGMIDNFLAGVNQGFTPNIATVATALYGAGKGLLSADPNAKSRALGATAGALNEAFNPQNTLYAKASGKNFSNNGIGENVANIAGFTAGELGKVATRAAAGMGVGSLETGAEGVGEALADVPIEIAAKTGLLAKLSGLGALKEGAQTLGKATTNIAQQGVAKDAGIQALKATPYLATKAGIGFGAGTGGSALASNWLQSTDAYKNMTPTDQQNALSVVGNIGGMGAGELANAVTSFASKRISPLRVMRDSGVSGVGATTHQEKNELDTINNLNQATKDNIAPFTTKTPPVSEVTPSTTVTDAVKNHVVPNEIDSSNLSNNLVADVNDFKAKASADAFKAKNDVMSKLNDTPVSQDDIAELQRNLRGSKTQAELEDYEQQQAPKPNLGLVVPSMNVPLDKSQRNVMNVDKTTGEVNLSLRPLDEMVDSKGDNSIHSNLGGVFKTLSDLSSIKDPSEPISNAHQTLLDDVGSYMKNQQDISSNNTNLIYDWLKNHVLDSADENATNKNIESLKDDDGHFSAQKIHDFLTNNNGLHQDYMNALDKNKLLAGQVVGHIDNNGLNEDDAKRFTNGISVANNRFNDTFNKVSDAQDQFKEKNDNARSTLKDLIGSQIRPVNGNAIDVKGEYAKQNGAIREYLTNLGGVLTTDDKGNTGNHRVLTESWDTIHDENADPKKQLDAIENLAPIFNHTGKLLATAKGAGFSHPVMGASFVQASKHLSDLHKEINFRKKIQELGGNPSPEQVLIAKSEANSEASEMLRNNKINNVSLGTGVGQTLDPNSKLVALAQSSVNHSGAHYLNMKPGRLENTTGSATLFGQKLNKQTTGNMTYGDVQKHIELINKMRIAHPEADKAGDYKNVLEQLNGILQKGILREGGQDNYDKYITASKLQHHVLNLRDRTRNATEKPTLGKEGYQRTATPDFGTDEQLPALIHNVATAHEQLTGEGTLAPQADGIVGKIKQRMLMTGKPDELIEKTTQQANLPENQQNGVFSKVMRVLKPTGWRDVANRQDIGNSLSKLTQGNNGKMGDVPIGKGMLDNPEAGLDFLNKSEKFLDVSQSTNNPPVVNQMREQLKNDIAKSINSNFDTVAQEAMANGNTAQALAHMKKLAGNVQTLGKSPVFTDLMKDTGLMEKMTAIQKSEEAIPPAIMKSNSPVKILLQRHQNQGQIIQQMLNTLTPALAGGKRTPTMEDLNNDYAWKGDSKIGQVMRKLVGGLHPIAHIAEKLAPSQRELGTADPVTQRRAIVKAFIDHVTAPDNVIDETGKTKGERVRDLFHEASAKIAHINSNKWSENALRNKTMRHGYMMGNRGIVAPWQVGAVATAEDDN